MIELQIINRVLKTKNLSFLIYNGIDENYFQDYKEEITYIFEHNKKYNCVPDEHTFFDKFPDCESIIVSESEKYLIDKLKENYVYSQTVPVVNKIIELAETDANAAAEYMSTQAPKLIKSTAVDGINIMGNARERLEYIEKLQKLKESALLSTGDPHLDELLGGGFLKGGEDLITFVARPNQGKSWALIFLASLAWQQNMRVGFYSGEMGTNIVGFRADTIIKHFSNTMLMSAQFENPLIFKEYQEYIDNVSKMENPLFTVTRKELGGKATVSKIDAFVDKNDLDIMFIDQYSLMDDEKRQRGSQRRDEYGRITDGLMGISIKHSIPIIGASQASRTGAKKNVEEGESLTPDLEDVAESDQIPQNSTRVIGMRQSDNVLEYCKRKDRYFGHVGQSIFYHWDINYGKLIYVPDSSTRDREVTKYERAERPARKRNQDIEDVADCF